MFIFLLFLLFISFLFITPFLYIYIFQVFSGRFYTYGGSEKKFCLSKVFHNHVPLNKFEKKFSSSCNWNIYAKQQQMNFCCSLHSLISPPLSFQNETLDHTVHNIKIYYFCFRKISVACKSLQFSLCSIHNLTASWESILQMNVRVFPRDIRTILHAAWSLFNIPPVTSCEIFDVCICSSIMPSANVEICCSSFAPAKSKRMFVTTYIYQARQHTKISFKCII